MMHSQGINKTIPKPGMQPCTRNFYELTFASKSTEPEIARHLWTKYVTSGRV